MCPRACIAISLRDNLMVFSVVSSEGSKVKSIQWCFLSFSLTHKFLQIPKNSSNCSLRTNIFKLLNYLQRQILACYLVRIPLRCLPNRPKVLISNFVGKYMEMTIGEQYSESPAGGFNWTLTMCSSHLIHHVHGIIYHIERVASHCPNRSYPSGSMFKYCTIWSPGGPEPTSKTTTGLQQNDLEIKRAQKDAARCE